MSRSRLCLQYYTKLTQLWSEYYNIRRGNDIILEERVLLNFLQDLNESFVGIMGEIMAMGPHLSIGKAYSMVAHEEQQKSDIMNENEPLKALAIQQEAYITITYSESSFCTHCKRSSHIIDTFHQLHNFPDGKNNQSSYNSHPGQRRSLDLHLVSIGDPPKGEDFTMTLILKDPLKTKIFKGLLIGLHPEHIIYNMTILSIEWNRFSLVTLKI